MKQFELCCDLLLNEHCKTGALHSIFNILQQKVFLAVYTMMTGDVPLSHDSENSAILHMILNTDAAKILGDELCLKIPDKKVKDYTKKDIDKWAKYVYDKIKEDDEFSDTF